MADESPIKRVAQPGERQMAWHAHRRLMQCPGCWAHGVFAPPPNGWIECDCGERMTVVDLREDLVA